MGQADWTFMTDSLDTSVLDCGVTTGFPRPNGGGSFVFGFNSLVVVEGATALFANQSGFAPTTANKGGRVTGCVKRAPSGGNTGFAPFLFIGAQGTGVEDSAYMIGLSDEDPYHIVLRKGAIIQGLPSAVPGASGILRKSTATFDPDTWFQLRLDMIVNLNGDVLLKAFMSDLTANACTSPVWTTIPGVEDTSLETSHGTGIAFIDDALGVNSGSAPFTSGRIGFGMYVKDVARRGVFDQIEVIRQA